MPQKENSKLVRIPLGIPGFDALVEGGIPLHSVIFIGGRPGAGKTTFVLQVAMNKIKKKRKLHI